MSTRVIQMHVLHCSYFLAMHEGGRMFISAPIAIAANIWRAPGGNLPILKSLDVGSDLWDGVDIFGRAPALTTVALITRLGSGQGNITNLRWPKIRTLVVTDSSGMVPSSSLSFAQSLGIGAALRLRLAGHVHDIPAVSPRPRICSDIQSLSLELELKASPASPSVQKLALGQIFESLTLPYLQRLGLVPKDGIQSPPVWHQEIFLDFALRSSLHKYLTHLTLHAQITDQELLECLSRLPLLEELNISERNIPLPHIPITDTLLQGLTWRPDDIPLIPRLRSLHLSSRLRFTDNTYWELVVSRVTMRRNSAGGPFTTELRCLRHVKKRKFSQKVRSSLSGLASQGDLQFVYISKG
ncbi:F-box domain-containing protein [Mycena venus]|uniref:F-box domain-containing protein n=1 Tax=Mycena venus TaxID=2733690 RepID=A0A8H7CEY7_9AGAR|nr:F-box domain-containing protein [Mycena venus]